MEPERDPLLAGRARARERVAALEREFAALAEAASAAGTDDEHDPEGATLAFERQHAAALLEAAAGESSRRERPGVRPGPGQGRSTGAPPSRPRSPCPACPARPARRPAWRSAPPPRCKRAARPGRTPPPRTGPC